MLRFLLFSFIAFFISSLNAQNSQIDSFFIPNEYLESSFQLKPVNAEFVLSGSTSDGSQDGIMKLDMSGNTIWSKTFGGSKDDYATGIKPMADGSFVVIGYSNSFNENDLNQIYILKIDAIGNLLWEKQFGSDVPNDYFGMDVLLEGNEIIVSGYKTKEGEEFTPEGQTVKIPDFANSVVIRLNGNGQILKSNENLNFDVIVNNWNGDLFTTAKPKTFSIINSKDGGYLLTGSSDPFGEVNFQEQINLFSMKH